MKEEFLHHTWRYRLFRQFSLETEGGEELEIIRTGEYNTDSGPDFFNAQVKIGGQLWAGNVEIHTRSSDWKKHGHAQDGSYDNIILHVVYEHDERVLRQSGEEIPVLVLKHRMDESAYARYLHLYDSPSEIPCSSQLAETERIVISAWLDRLLAERLESRAGNIMERVSGNRNNWEESFYQLLARNFGFQVNAGPFEQLARILPLSIIAKHRDHPLQVEALFFGQAGLLQDKFREKYPRALQKEYRFLQKKFSLSPLDAHLWKFMRMRPVNFPSVRLAQFVALLQHTAHFFSKMLEAKDLDALRALFQARINDYWKDHYVFGTRSVKKEKALGQEAIDNILINTVAPFIFVYGKERGEERLVRRALQLLEGIAGERNHIVHKWEGLGMPVDAASNTQALLQLKKEYCDKKRCLQCAIGAHLLSKKNAAV